MQLISDVSFANGVQTRCDCNPQNGFIKILATGELAAQGQDRRLLIRINGANTSYKSFVLMNGDSSAGEWDETGIYVGRNGWGLDATFSLDFTLGIFSNAQKITGTGSAVFAHGDNRILGYECHGFFVSNDSVRSIDVIFTGGTVNGHTRIYQL
ncbi:hypothetical protein NSQ90_21960 [Paenibacillus sp. FSL H7-0737]|uniref:hypothetical protein n=1 Tax=Paenibacillus sp. FSL H7-0737 TaxID=1536775 RepID=UPI0005AAECA4|nr:hypothetical protein [Paenibacillus sp. FSL H7-0737]